MMIEFTVCSTTNVLLASSLCANLVKNVKSAAAVVTSHDSGATRRKRGVA
jgi:hypothetical protein